MTNFDIAKKNYDRGLWTDGMIAKLVTKGRLTAEEYQKITGKAYTA